MTSSQSNSNRETVTVATHQVHTDAAMYKATLYTRVRFQAVH